MIAKNFEIFKKKFFLIIPIWSSKKKNCHNCFFLLFFSTISLCPSLFMYIDYRYIYIYLLTYSSFTRCTCVVCSFWLQDTWLNDWRLSFSFIFFFHVSPYIISLSLLIFFFLSLLLIPRLNFYLILPSFSFVHSLRPCLNRSGLSIFNFRSKNWTQKKKLSRRNIFLLHEFIH